MSVLKGMLCMSMNRLWWLDICVMEEYGVVRLWTRKFSTPMFRIRVLPAAFVSLRKWGRSCLGL